MIRIAEIMKEATLKQDPIGNPSIGGKIKKKNPIKSIKKNTCKILESLEYKITSLLWPILIFKFFLNFVERINGAKRLDAKPIKKVIINIK